MYTVADELNILFSLWEVGALAKPKPKCPWEGSKECSLETRPFFCWSYSHSAAGEIVPGLRLRNIEGLAMYFQVRMSNFLKVVDVTDLERAF